MARKEGTSPQVKGQVKGAARGGTQHYVKLGQILLDDKLISKRQLNQALRGQKRLRTSLGHTLVEMGIVSEAQIVEAFNRRYQSNLTSLADDLDAYLRTRGLKSGGKRFGFRVSIKTKLSIAIIFIIWLTILGLSFVILTRQREHLYQQTVKTGKVSLNYIANNARIPLINENILGLNTLVKETASVEGVLYAVITDREGIVQAHTDPTRIRKKRAAIPDASPPTRDGEYAYFNYTAGDGTKTLDIAMPVTFQDKALGNVSVGVSLDFIQEQITRETIYIVALSLLIIVLGIVIAIFMGESFSRPISDLVLASNEIGLGNLRYRIKRIRNDELGDLASSFNFMGGELLKKALMQESFGKYVGSEVLDLIMADPENVWLKGKRSQASILFTDIRGFTSYSETREPEQVVEALNAYFDIATRTIHKFGGYVDKFIGDAVMGVFGVPLESKDHAGQAVRAALAMQKEFAEAGPRLGNEVVTRVGIGINSGPVVSGNIGSQDKMEYTVIGDAVNVASRLNNLAGPGETVISKSVRDALPGLLELQPLPPQKVKGKSEPLEVFKVLAIGEVPPVARGAGDARPATR
jgi:adenylate cyclase